jgi:uncharacterized protein (TIGR00369 family)
LSERKPLTGSRFICGAPPINVGLQLYLEPDKHVTAKIILDEHREGPPKHVHGGASAALIDEVMGAAVWNSGYQVVAAHLSFDYKRPVPLGEEITIKGYVERVEGKKVFTTGKITLSNGDVAVEGHGIFVEAPHLFDEHPEFAEGFQSNSRKS